MQFYIVDYSTFGQNLQAETIGFNNKDCRTVNQPLNGETLLTLILGLYMPPGLNQVQSLLYIHLYCLSVDNWDFGCS